MALFGPIIPIFHFARIGFHYKVIKLLTIDKWQEGMLSLVFDFHTHVIKSQLINLGR